MSSSDATCPSTQLWLKGLLPTQDSVTDVAQAFLQWIGTSGGSPMKQSHKYHILPYRHHNVELPIIEWTCVLTTFIFNTCVYACDDNHWHADMSDTSDECAVKMISDPVTRMCNGHATVKMISAHQATWVMKDLNDMLFVVSTGPRPLQASVAMAGK